MLLDRLWIRIKGELLSLKEDIAGDTDLRSQAELLLDRLESRLMLPSSEKDRSRDPAQRIDTILKRMEEEQDTKADADTQNLQADRQEHSSVREIEKIWDDFLEKRDERKGQTEDAKDDQPNPRRLG
jgi:hypothetical protein